MSGESFVQIGTAVIALLGAVITYILVPYIKSKTTAAQQEGIAFWVSMAVDAAEQIYKGDKLGDQRKKCVLEFLNKKGFKVSALELDMLIEAAVSEMNQLKS